MTRIMSAFLLSILFLVPALLSATTIVPSAIGQFTKESKAVIKGKVIKTETISENDKIFTLTTISPSETFKGENKDDYIVKTRGGTYGDLTMYIPGTPSFRENEDVVLFLRDENEDKTFNISAMALGRLEIEYDEKNHKEYIVSKNGGILLDDKTTVNKLTIDDFRKFVKNETGSSNEISDASIEKTAIDPNKPLLVHIDDDKHNLKQNDSNASTSITSTYIEEKENNHFTIKVIIGMIMAACVFYIFKRSKK